MSLFFQQCYDNYFRVARLEKSCFTLAMTIASMVNLGELDGGKRVKKISQSMFDFLKGKTTEEQREIMQDILAGKVKIGDLNIEKRVGLKRYNSLI